MISNVFHNFSTTGLTQQIVLRSRKTLAVAFFSVAALSFSAPAAAQSPTLFDRLGGLPAIEAVVNDFVGNVVQDPRIGHYFTKTNGDRLGYLLVQQICEASGGPCTYPGQDMKTAHAGMNISKADFNALVEVLQDSMSAKGVPMKLQLELLALLAPMHRDMIER